MGVIGSTLSAEVSGSFSPYIGTPSKLNSQAVTTPGVVQSLLTLSLSPGEIRRLFSIFVTCSTQTWCYLEKDGVKIASMRTGAGNKNVQFYFAPLEEIIGPATLELKCMAHASFQPADVEAYLMFTIL